MIVLYMFFGSESTSTEFLAAKNCLALQCKRIPGVGVNGRIYHKGPR